MLSQVYAKQYLFVSVFCFLAVVCTLLCSTSVAAYYYYDCILVRMILRSDGTYGDMMLLIMRMRKTVHHV